MKAGLVMFLVLTASVAVGAELEFGGTPWMKVEAGEGAAKTEAVARQRAHEYSVKVTRNGDEYLWASRNNQPMVRRESGIYVTYIATSGAGYVRVLNPAMRQLHSKLPSEQRDKEYLYMEHLVHQLGSITYFGR